MSARYDRMRRVTAFWVERKMLALPLPASVQRPIFEAQAWLNAAPSRIDRAWRYVAGVTVRVATPPEPRGRLLWLHGGGFRIGSPRTHGRMLDRLALASGLEVWAPRYRLAPEHPFPAGLDDCLAVARAMPGPFHLAGDSAGGCLALATLQTLLVEDAAPLSVVLVSPIVDMRATRPEPPDTDLILPAVFLRRCRAGYVGDADDCDPRVSPVLGYYPDCPPVHLELSEGEALEGDGHAIAAHLMDQGADVSVHVEPGVPHVYHLTVGRSSAADRAIARLAEWLR